MPNWVCPECNGGFARLAETDDGLACPWCEVSVSAEPREVEDFPIISRTTDDENEDNPGLLKQMFT